MRRFIALVLVMLLAMGMTAYAEEANEGTVAVEAPEVLKVDVRGEKVHSLQAKLNELGFYCGKADGIFGPRTETALMELQDAIGWNVTGELRVEELETVLTLTEADVLSGNVEKPAEAPVETEQPQQEAGTVEAAEAEAGNEESVHASEDTESTGESVGETEEDIGSTDMVEPVEESLAEEIEEKPVEEASAGALQENDEEAEAPADDTVDSELEVGNGINLVWDGRFQNKEQYWDNWGHPTLCEIVEVDGQNWMHLVSSGVKFEGLAQDASRRSGNFDEPEIYAGETYTLSFKARAEAGFDGTLFRVLVHNVALETNKEGKRWNRVQYVMEETPISETEEIYTLTFTPETDGTFRVMIGTACDIVLDAYFSDIKLEKGSSATEWSECPEIQ